MENLGNGFTTETTDEAAALVAGLMLTVSMGRRDGATLPDISRLCGLRDRASGVLDKARTAGSGVCRIVFIDDGTIRSDAKLGIGALHAAADLHPAVNVRHAAQDIRAELAPEIYAYGEQPVAAATN